MPSKTVLSFDIKRGQITNHYPNHNDFHDAHSDSLHGARRQERQKRRAKQRGNPECIHQEGADTFCYQYGKNNPLHILLFMQEYAIYCADKERCDSKARKILGDGEQRCPDVIPCCPDDAAGDDGEDLPYEDGLPGVDEDGTYNSAEDVSLYLYTFGHLPDNYITKNEARDLGWSGGSVEKYAPGCAIGGDKFGNREGVLPEGTYHECDIDTIGESSRGAKRLVYGDDGRIYYTEDHYETFELLYGEE